jgi:hypothetical protein
MLVKKMVNGKKEDIEGVTLNKYFPEYYKNIVVSFWFRVKNAGSRKAVQIPLIQVSVRDF